MIRRSVMAGVALIFAGCHSPASSHLATFVGCEGRAVAYDMERDTIARVRPLADAPSLGLTDNASWDGCLVEGEAYDSSSHTVFLVLADRPHDALDDPRSYRVVAAQFPSFKRISSVDIPDHARPVLLFDSYRAALIAQWTTPDSLRDGEEVPGWRLTTWTLTPATLEVRKMAEQLIPNVMDGSFVAPVLHDPNAFTDTPRADANGQVVDDDVVIRWIGDSLSAAVHAVTLSAAQERAARDIAGDTATFWFRSADAREARVLMQLSSTNEAMQGMGLLLKSVSSDTTNLPVIAALTGRARLLGDQRRILVQGIDGSLRHAMSGINTTGEIQVIDGETGHVELTLSDKRLAGSFEIVRPICSSPDGDRVFLRGPNAEFTVLNTRTGDISVFDITVQPTDFCIFGS